MIPSGRDRADLANPDQGVSFHHVSLAWTASIKSFDDRHFRQLRLDFVGLRSWFVGMGLGLAFPINNVIFTHGLG